QLQDHHPTHMLLQVCVDACDRRSDTPVTVAHELAEDHGGEEDQRQHGERDQRQPPIDTQHEGADQRQYQYILYNGDHSGGEHTVQRIGVGGHACHQPAHRVLVVELDMHLLQMAEDLAAQIEHHQLADPLHVIGLQIFQEKTDDEKADVDERDLPDAG